MKIKIIIFDFDDTLVDTKRIKWKALKETGRRNYGLAINDSDILYYWGLPFNKMLTGVLKNKEDFDSLKVKYTEVSREYPLELFPDVFETIKLLSDSITIGILTSSTRSLVEADLEMLGFTRDDFFYVQTCEDTKIHKPNPNVFDPILKKIKNYNLNQILYVGDSLKDYFAAKNKGLDFIGIARDNTTQEIFLKNNAKFITDFKDLLVYI